MHSVPSGEKTNLFNQSHTDAYLSYLLFCCLFCFVVANNISINILVHIFWKISAMILWRTTPGSKPMCLLNFKRFCYTAFQKHYTNWYQPLKRLSLFPHPCHHQELSHFSFSQTCKVKKYLNVVLTWSSFIINKNINLLICLFKDDCFQLLLSSLEQDNQVWAL